MKLVCLLYMLIIATACHKKSSPDVQNLGAESVALSQDSSANSLKNKVLLKPKFSKTFREALYFAKSLEREALRLILKEQGLEKQSLFGVLSYAVEIESGYKKSAPQGIDCNKFEFKFLENTISLLKACFRPAIDILTIRVLKEDQDYEFKFRVGQWGSVLGPTAVITGSDILCRMRIVSSKLNHLRCENWTHQVNQDQLTVTVIKTDEFLFQRNANQQFVIKGGFYKELVKNKIIDIQVPLEGKIKIIEEEIRVIDEFANEKDGFLNGKKQEEVTSEKTEEISGEKTESQSEGQVEDQSQKGDEEGQPQKSDSQSQQVDQSESNPINNEGQQQPVEVEGGRRNR